MGLRSTLVIFVFLCCSTVNASSIYLNEFLYNPTPGVDANGDGTVDALDDEFVELVNGGLNPVELFGYSISDSSATRHVFSPFSLCAGCSVVVFGGPSILSITDGSAFTASTGVLALNNSGDSIILRDSMGSEVFNVDYSSFPTAAGTSLTLAALGANPEYVLHSGISNLLVSPGMTTAGETFPVSTVPVPAALWLFGTALMGLVGFSNRRKPA